MAYFIPTATPEDTGRKRKTTMFRATAMLEIQQEPRYAAGDLVTLNGGIFMVRSVTRRTARHGKGKGCFLYGIGCNQPVAENKLATATEEFLSKFYLNKVER